MRPQKILYASLFATGLAVPLASPSYANIVISINKSTQRMLVAVDGATRYDWPVSTGRAGYDTPSGVFKVNRMDAAHHSKEYENAFMPDSMFFDLKGHAIHGFNDVPQLGMAVSHGCVRLSPANAAILFGLVKQEGMANTTVEISGHIPARGPLVASRQAPTEQAEYESQYQQPMSIQPGYRQPQPYYQQQPYYGRQQAYEQPQPYYGRSRYYQGSAPTFPPQPPAYGQPYYGGGYYYRQY